MIIRPIAHEITEAVLSQIFTHCAPIARLYIFRAMPPTTSYTTSFALIEFIDPFGVIAAQGCSGIAVGSEQIVVEVASSANLPHDAHVSPTLVTPLVPLPPTPTTPSTAAAVAATQASLLPILSTPVPLPTAAATIAAFNPLLLQNRAPLTAEQADQVSRTVYVGNVSSQVRARHCSTRPIRSSCLTHGCACTGVR